MFLSKQRLRILPILFAICVWLPGMAAGASLLPSADSLFGVTMPDVRFALDREPDASEDTAEGQTFVFQSFTPADYRALDKYLASYGMKLKASSSEGKRIYADLEKDDAVITFTYDYPEKTASMFYPSSVRIEQEASKAPKAEGILPVLEQTIGTAVPNFRKILADHPEPETDQAADHDAIVYSGITEEDYSRINGYLTDRGFALHEWHLEKGILNAEVERGEEMLLLQYSLTAQQLTWVCPELYYEEDALDMPKKPKQDALPEFSVVFDAVMPRISSAILRYPDETETMDDGSLKEVYLKFTEEEYDALSRYLSGTACELGEYAVDETGVLSISLLQKGSGFTFSYDRVGQKGTAVYPPEVVVEPQKTITAQAETEQPSPAKSEVAEEAISQQFIGLKAGDKVTMGYYEQDGDTDNFREPIEWTIIAVDKKKNQALLLSDFGLDGVSYGETMNPDEYAREGISWENSHLRGWLNDDFYGSSFSDSEKERIVEATLKTSDKAKTPSTTDKLFVLSKAEANQYLKKASAMACALTEYSKNTLRVEQGAETEDGYCLWWLRDMVKVAKTNKKGELVSGNEAGFVGGGNGLKTFNKGDGCPVFCDYLCAVRPAMWIQLDEAPKVTPTPKPTKKPTPTPKKRSSSSSSSSSRYMSDSDLKDLARFYFGLYIGSSSSIQMVALSTGGNDAVALIVYSGGQHAVSILMDRRDGSFKGYQRGY